jgi:archaellum component FlaC
MYQNQDKTLNKLYEKLAEIEKDILEKQAEGVDVTAALARIASVRAVIGSVKGAFDVNNIDEVKRLAKEARKLTHFAKEEDLHDAKEVSEDAAKVSKRITQAYGKIALFEGVGGDGKTFKASLAAFEADLATLRAAISSGGYDPETMSESLEMLEKKVKSLKNSIEGSIYALGGTDSELDDDFEDESEDIAEHLNDVADIEDDSVGRAIRRIADDHKDAAKKVSEAVKDVDKRNPVLQTLFGASAGDLNDLEQEIAANKARTAALLRAANAIEDADVKAILLDQVAVLQAQAAKLEMFVGGQRDRLSVFGWLFNLF